jgi:hypothetical protein
LRPSRLRRFAAQLRRRILARPTGQREPEVAREIANEFSSEELKEFLEGGLEPTQADPEFRERLRRELWELVQERYGRNPGDRLD